MAVTGNDTLSDTGVHLVVVLWEKVRIGGDWSGKAKNRVTKNYGRRSSTVLTTAPEEWVIWSVMGLMSMLR